MKLERIKKGAYKDYVANGVFGGFALSIIFSLVSIPTDGLSQALKNGLITGFLISFFLMTFGFFHVEWYERKRKIKKLNSGFYNQLKIIGLFLDNDINYTGTIDNYDLSFNTFEKRINNKKLQDRNSIEILCFPSDFNSLGICIEKVRNIDGVQSAAWGYGRFSVYMVPDFSDFNDLILKVINNLKVHSIRPITAQAEKQNLDMQLENDLEKHKKKRTIQILKFWKVDIKYEKPIK
jgi:hypothetical protein